MFVYIILIKLYYLPTVFFRLMAFLAWILLNQYQNVFIEDLKALMQVALDKGVCQMLLMQWLQLRYMKHTDVQRKPLIRKAPSDLFVTLQFNFHFLLALSLEGMLLLQLPLLLPPGLRLRQGLRFYILGTSFQPQVASQRIKCIMRNTKKTRVPASLCAGLGSGPVISGFHPFAALSHAVTLPAPGLLSHHPPRPPVQHLPSNCLLVFLWTKIR